MSVAAYHLESTLAEFATSRGAQFARRIDWPWPDLAPAAEAGLAEAFAAHVAGGAEGPLPAPAAREALGRRTGDAGVAAQMMDWFAAMPVNRGGSPQACAFYWHDVFFLTLGADHAHLPGVAPDLWRGLVAAVRRQPFEGPDAVAAAHRGYLRRTERLEPLEASLRDWQMGPFTDLDLALARHFGWDLAEGGIWLGWQAWIDWRRITELWQAFGPLMSEAEQEALVAWRRGPGTPTEEEEAIFADPMIAGLLAEAEDRRPPCHPREILSAHA